MKNYSSTPARWLIVFVTFMMASLLFCVIMILLTNQVEKIKIGNTNYQYPIQVKSYLTKNSPAGDSLYSKLEQSNFINKIESEYQVEIFKVQLLYKLNKQSYSGLHLGYKIGFVCFLLVIFYQLYLFRKALKNFINKNPFKNENIKLLRRAGFIGLVMVVLEILFSFSKQFLAESYFNHKLFFVSNPFPEFFTVNLIIVIFFFTIAEILKMGMAYKQENELTV